jgi:hypothetical protein
MVAAGMASLRRFTQFFRALGVQLNRAGHLQRRPGSSRFRRGIADERRVRPMSSQAFVARGFAVRTVERMPR